MNLTPDPEATTPVVGSRETPMCPVCSLPEPLLALEAAAAMCLMSYGGLKNWLSRNRAILPEPVYVATAHGGLRRALPASVVKLILSHRLRKWTRRYGA